MINLHKYGSVLLPVLLFLGGCGGGDNKTRVEQGIEQQILYVNNGMEPEDLDPHITTGLPESYIIRSLVEGLVAMDPENLEPIPAVAESWDISEDLSKYTFHLRKNVRWSNGDPVTAEDFYYSWERVISPKLASEYSYMLYPIRNARAFNLGEITDFSEVGVKVIDDYTFEVTLNSPTPYFLQILDHHSFYPVHKATIEKFGDMDTRGTVWTRPENFTGNGPFILKEWSPNRVLIVEKNDNYWDAQSVRLNQVHYYPIENKQTEERMFRTGQIHMTMDGKLLTEKIPVYRKENPELIQIYPYLGSYYYEFNTKRKPFDDYRVRRAFSMAIDRVTICENVARGGKIPAYALTPPDTAGYTPRARIEFDPDAAGKLLAEAGYPDGDGFPRVELLYNTMESHRTLAIALQQMWKKYLNVDVTLVNQEWKVYLDSRDNLDYYIARAGWVGDYPDPNTFLDMFITESGNNRPAWSNAEYDRLISEANRTADKAARYELYQRAEEILIEESPVAPLYYETSIILKHPSVKGIHQNLLTIFPFKYVYLSAE